MSRSEIAERRDLDRSGDQFARRPAGGHRDDDRLQLQPGGTLGQVDGLANRCFGGSARSITVPAFMPSASVWPKPMTSIEWLRPRSTSCGRTRPQTGRSGRRSCWCRRRAPRSAPSGWREAASSSASGRCWSVLMCHAPSSSPSSPLRRSPRLRGGVGQPHRDAVGKAKIDGDDVAGDQVLLPVERDQPVERSLDAGLRQPHVDAVLQPQVPAPLSDQDRWRAPTRAARDGGRAARRNSLACVSRRGRPRAATASCRERGTRRARCRLRR